MLVPMTATGLVPVLASRLGDMASISVGAQMGSDINDVDFWGASILASMNLSDTSHIEVAYGHKDYDSSCLR